METKLLVNNLVRTDSRGSMYARPQQAMRGEDEPCSFDRCPGGASFLRQTTTKFVLSPTAFRSSAILFVMLTLAPIWLPHWPAWIWTISRIVFLLWALLERTAEAESTCNSHGHSTVAGTASKSAFYALLSRGRAQ